MAKKRLQAKREAAAEERRLQAEREIAAEERTAEGEVEERRAEREAEERILLAKHKAEERKADMELERLKLELELPAFVNGRDDLDNYLLRFERYATVAGWEKEA